MLDSFENLKIDFENKIVFLDIDGTLIPDNEINFSAQTVECLDKIKQKNKLYLCTNSLNSKRNKNVEGLLNIELLIGGKKPFKGIIKDLDLEKKDCVVIGDKFLTDGLFAKNIGAEFIMVKKKISGKERPIIKIIDFFDNLVYKLYRMNS
ncbi:HAD hydrolase-like protein [Patescibacteria group bacterium]|nr:HAD hydrolase-like protein [Patescibacteria group bacterium]